MSQIVKLDKEKQEETALITALSHDGRGIANIKQKTTFIAGALPQEVVAYRVFNKKNSYQEAELVEISQKSTQRIDPICKHFGTCGGCSLQHMSIDMQLQLKQQTLLDQLKHFGQVTPETILPALCASTVAYRRKARLGVKFVHKKNKLLVGFREKSSRYLADLENCAVLHPQVGQRLRELSDLIASLSCYQTIPQVEVAIGDEDVALVFRHLETLIDADRDTLIQFGKNNHFHIYLQPNPPALVNPIWLPDGKEKLTYSLPDYQLEFLFHPLDFTQINLEMNRLMVNQVISKMDINRDDDVLDLFCGIGNFTLAIARFARSVTGIEGSAEMVTRAYANAKHNNLTNVEFNSANLMNPESFPWMRKSYSKVLLDPPRAGAKETLPLLGKFAAKKIIYVSCNPATLARDAGELVHKYGYRLTEVGVINMFPHTSHIEAMAVFER